MFRRSRKGSAFFAAGTLLAGVLTAVAASPAGAATPGDLVINEVMQNPSAVGDNSGEWFELVNVSGAAVDINGWTISDGDTDSHVISNGGPLTIPAGDFFVLGVNGDSGTNGGVTVDYVYTGITLANGADELIITDPGAVEYDRIEWDGGPAWPDPNGASMNLTPSAANTAANDVGSNWCEGTVTFGAGDSGTPGAANTNCAGSGPAPGDLVINEVIQNPSSVADGSGEWFEIYNASSNAIDIDGWTISDNDSDSHVISSNGPLLVPAGDFFVLGVNGDSGTNGGVTVDYVYTGITLANGADELIITDSSSVEFDRIEWDGGLNWPNPNGASMNLDPASANTTANDDGANWCEATASFGSGDLGTPGAANTECDVIPPAAVLIHEIQGSGSSVAITIPVQVEAIVTSLFERDDALDGFFIQEESLQVDGDPQTSEGIFVFCRGNCPTVDVGDLVEVTGTPTDFFGMSQIEIAFGSGTATVLSSGNSLPDATSIDLPAADSTLAEATFEATEGMIVSFADTLAVSEYFQLGRFGQIVLTDTSRPYQFTHSNTPSVAGNAAFLADLAARRIILDDDNNDNNDAISDGPDENYPYPDPALSTTNRFRGGDTITNLTGVLHWSFAGSGGTDAWRVRPIDGIDYTFTPVNPAPTSPDSVGGTLEVASFNVLNYFTTVDNGPNICGPSATQDCRGADSVAELATQRAKIVAALAEMDSDVVGLIEIQNDAGASVADLVAGLNGQLGAGIYDYIDTGFIGTDAIKVAFIYKPASVTPLGDFAILDSSVDPAFIDTKNRPVLIQTFEQASDGERFTVAVNHLKSKGSSCSDVGDPEPDDGQASCAATRTAAAQALADYLATDPTGSADPDYLIIGDLNSYAMEDPIVALTNAGYTDLVNFFEGPNAYSFVFDGQLGYLDHALANGALTTQVTGTTVWHINADEINLFDYNDAVEDPGESFFERESTIADLSALDELRSSDHDPVVVGLNLRIPDNPTCNGLAATIIGTNGDDVIVGTNKADVIVTFGGNDTITGGNGADVICSGFGDDVIDGGNGKDYIDAGAGDDVVDGGNGKDVIFGGADDDYLDGGKGKDDIDGGDGIDTCVNGPNVVACELP